ncbi:MAG: hypothetical protein KUG77_08520 [Nannocystaceae bacterium]|nr:hypothetical protein [Nannocystaceae bacterium]
MVPLRPAGEFKTTMMRALTLCSLLLLPLSACDDTAFDLVQTADRPAIPDPPDVEGCQFYCSDYRAACENEQFGYASVAECETVCGYWEAEEDSACRVDVLDDIAAHAVESLESACIEAGPDSDACGPGYVISCNRYCDEFRTACNDEGGFDAAFESPQKCLAWCDGERLLGDDDSIECRLGSLASLAAPPDCETASPGATCK